MNIYDNNINLIINVDETPVYLESTSTITVVIKGQKEININTFKNDKNRVTCILAIACNQFKFPLLLIFKGQKEKILENQLNKLDLCKNKKILLNVILIHGAISNYLFFG